MEYLHMDKSGEYTNVGKVDDYSHIILSSDEYSLLLTEIRTAKNQAKRAEEKSEEAVQERIRKEIDIQREATQSLLAEARAETEEKLSELNNLKRELENQRSLNENMLRICRERANSARGLVPKKQHDGYIVRSCQQWKQKYNIEVPMPGYEDRDREWLEQHDRLTAETRIADVWKSIIQTPYNIGLRMEDIEDQILCDLKSGILLDVGIEKIVKKDANGQNNRMARHSKIPLLYKWNFRANMASGLWEMEIYTTQSLIIPERRRPANYKEQHRD